MNGQLAPSSTELLDLVGIHELRNRVIDRLNEAEGQGHGSTAASG
jgi:hypothetical protein